MQEEMNGTAALEPRVLRFAPSPIAAITPDFLASQTNSSPVELVPGQLFSCVMVLAHLVCGGPCSGGPVALRRHQGRLPSS